MRLAQGTILSPIIYVIYTIGLDKILPEKVKIIQYADDVCLYVGGKSIHACQSLLDRALSRVLKWMSNHGLEITFDRPM